MSDANETNFPWGPAHYLRIAILMSIGIHAYLYIGMIVLTYWVNGQAWILGWKPAVVAVLSTLIFMRIAYSWMMRLDARYGRGSGWTLVSKQVKLPEIATRSKTSKGDRTR